MYQLSLFQLRERGLLELLTAQVTSLVKQGMSMTDATILVYFHSTFNAHPIVSWIVFISMIFVNDFWMLKQCQSFLFVV